MATTSKIPGQLYVTAKLQPIYDTGGIIGYDKPLGFLNAYEPSKTTFAKKMDTQINWAYRGYIHNFKLEQQGTKWWITGSEYAPFNPTCPRTARQLVQIHRLADPQPAIWDNVPTEGFKIENSVSRYSTSNKLWRVSDPRGFEFEITTACLETIINDVGILKGGMIDAKCVWMANKNLVVVP